MALNVKFENEQGLINFFRSSLKDIGEDIKKNTLKDMSSIMLKIGPKEEKKIFRYIANRVMGHVNPPKQIEGKPAFQDVVWKPLAKSTVRKKGHKRKWIDSGSLKNYLRGLSAAYWYGKPKTIIDGDSVTYYSMFNYNRKPFGAHDHRGVSQEFKITGDGAFGEDGDNINRPIFEPMQEFIFYEKVEDMINEAINDYMEENYGVRYNVPTTY